MVDETSLDLSTTRRLWMVDSAKWTGSGTAFWLEWDHPLEATRSLSSIIEGLEKQNWPRLIKPGSTCIDIGAHSGDTAIPMGLFAFDRLTGKKGKVVAVEPNPDIQSLLISCLGMNQHIADYYLENCAVTKEDCLEVTLSDHGNSNCNGGIIGDYSADLVKKLETAAKRTYTAKGRSLNSIVQSHSRVGSAQDIQFIKTDCEGYDKELLRSAADILKQLKPTLFVEWFAMFSEADNVDFLTAFQEIEYIPLDPVTLKPLHAGHRPFDVVGVHKSQISSF